MKSKLGMLALLALALPLTVHAQSVITEKVIDTCVRLPDLAKKLEEIHYTRRACGVDQVCIRGVLPIRFRVATTVLFLGFQTVLSPAGQVTEVKVIDTEKKVQAWERREFRSAELRGNGAR